MQFSFLFSLTLVVVASASTAGTKDILVSNDGSKIIIINDNGKTVQIQNDKVNLNGNQVIEIQVSDTNQVTQTVQVDDKIVDADGTSQSTVLATIFNSFQGTINENIYENLLSIIAKEAMVGKISQNVLVALQVLSQQNDNALAQSTLNKILDEQELKDLVQKESWIQGSISQGQQKVFLEGNQISSTPLNNIISGASGQSLNVIAQGLEEEKLAKAIFGKKNVLVNDDGTKIAVVNQNGKTVKIQTDKVGPNGSPVIQVQLTGPKKITKTIEVIDNIVGPNGIQQSTILSQIFGSFEGSLNKNVFDDLLQILANQVSNGQINPTILIALEALENANTSGQIPLDELLLEGQLQDLVEQGVLQDALSGQGLQTVSFGQQSPLKQIQWNILNQQSSGRLNSWTQQRLQRTSIEREIEDQAITQAIRQEQRKIINRNQLGVLGGSFQRHNQWTKNLMSQQPHTQLLGQQIRLQQQQEQPVLGIWNPVQRNIWGLSGSQQSLARAINQEQFKNKMLNQLGGGLGGSLRTNTGFQRQNELIKNLENQQQVNQLLNQQAGLKLQQQQSQILGGPIPIQQNIWALSKSNLGTPKQWWNTGLLSSQNALNSGVLFGGRSKPLGLWAQNPIVTDL